MLRLLTLLAAALGTSVSARTPATLDSGASRTLIPRLSKMVATCEAHGAGKKFRTALESARIERHTADVILPPQIAKLREAARNAADSTPPNLELAASKKAEANALNDKARAARRRSAAILHKHQFLAVLEIETEADNAEIAMGETIATFKSSERYDEALVVSRQLEALRVLQHRLRSSEGYEVIAARLRDSSVVVQHAVSTPLNGEGVALPRPRLLLEIDALVDSRKGETMDDIYAEVATIDATHNTATVVLPGKIKQLSSEAAGGGEKARGGDFDAARAAEAAHDALLAEAAEIERSIKSVVQLRPNTLVHHNPPVFIHYHKTGHALTRSIVRSMGIVPITTRRVPLKCMDTLSIQTAPIVTSPLSCPIVHFIRNPIDMIISGYLYHRQQPTPETWIRNVDICGSSGSHLWKLCTSMMRTSMNYEQRLQELPEEKGVVLEALRGILSTNRYAGGDLKRMKMNIGLGSGFLNVYMRDIFDHPEQTYRKIMEFIGASGDVQAWLGYHKSPRHVTRNMKVNHTHLSEALLSIPELSPYL